MNEQQKSLFRSKESDDWGTPKMLYDQLDAEFHFDLDPCPLGSEVDGLVIDWNGSIFVNPPYSKVEQFLVKAHNELRGGRAHTVVFLVFANTDTEWFHRYIYGKAELRFIKGRIRFVAPGKTNGAMRPSMLAIFRKEDHMTIGKEILEAATRLTGSLLLKHKNEIDKAYMKAENALKVDIGITFKPAENGEVKLAVSIGFITDRVKDDISGQMIEGQMDLFEDSKKKKTGEGKAEPGEEETRALKAATPELTGNVVEVDFEKEEGAAGN